MVSSTEDLVDFLHQLTKEIKHDFSDFEIILTNPLHLDPSIINRTIKTAPPAILPYIHMLHFSKATTPNKGLLSALDTSNGDFVFIVDMGQKNVLQHTKNLYEKTQAGYDIIYLRDIISLSMLKRTALKVVQIIFYFLHLKLDFFIYQNKFISRRALNTLTSFRESAEMMGATLNLIGYSHTYINVDSKNNYLNRESFFKKIYKLLNIVIAYTNGLNIIIQSIIFVSILFSISVSINAISVKYLGTDIFGHPQQIVPGWTLNIVFLSIIFSTILSVLFLIYFQIQKISIYVKNRPEYIIKHIDRF